MIRLLAGLLGYVALFAGLLFAPAGTFGWWRAWVLLGVLLGVRSVSTVRLWPYQRALLEERTKLPLQAGQPLADRVLLLAFMASFAALVAFVSWDVWHLRLLPVPPEWARIAGLVAYAGGWEIVHLAMKSNAFAVTVVRFQGERGHALVERGAYGVVRHPMYAGLVAILLGLCAWLGSTAGLLVAVVPVGFLVARIDFEERVLRARFPGYESYAGRVRSRLIPRVW